MSRIRSVHPGLFTDENFMTLTVECPLAIPLLLGIWAEADDDGVFEWKPLTLKAKTIPATNADAAALLERLSALQFVRVFTVGGKDYGAIRNFKTWQRPKQPKVKYPKADWVLSYVGGNSGPPPHDFPTDGEIHPQREEEGGEMEEEITHAPHSEAERARSKFDDLQRVFPINPRSNLVKAKAAFNRLPADQQTAIVESGLLFRAWFLDDCIARDRSSEDGLPFAPHLVNWIASGDWRKAASLPIKAINGGIDPSLVVLRADDPRFAAVQRRRGDRPIIVGRNGSATFTKAEVEAAEHAV